MAKNKTNYVKLGIFVILAFIVFTYGVYRISDRKDFFRNTLELYVDFKDVKGLQAGNKVRFSGINIGNVTLVEIVNDTTLRAHMELDASVAEYLKKNTQASISSDGLVGNMLINLSPVKEKAPLIENGDVLSTKPSREIPEMLETLGTSNEAIELITLQLLEISTKMNQGEGSMALLLNDESMANNLASAMQSLETIASRLETATQEINTLVAGVTEGEGNLGYLLRDTSLKSQVDALSGSLDALINVQTVPIMENLMESSESIASASLELEGVLKELEREDGLVGMMLGDTISAEELRTTLQNLNEGTQKFDENMEALQYNWLFRKYYKKKEKGKLKTTEND